MSATMIVIVQEKQYEVPVAVRDELIALRQRNGVLTRPRFFVELHHNHRCYYRHFVMYADDKDAVAESPAVAKLREEGWCLHRVRELDPMQEVMDF